MADIKYKEERTGMGTGMGMGGGGSEEFWIMNLKVVAISPIYTGENKMGAQRERKTGNRLPTRKSGDGYAIVNISGLIRSYVEKIYRNEETCDIGKNAKGCGICLSCDMFGYLGRRGRVSIDELRSTEAFNKVVDMAVHPRIDRETGTIPQERGASLELEEIQEGTELIGKIMIRNPKERDLEILESAIKAMEVGGMGGWTRRGKGRCSISVTLDKKKWSDYKEMGKEEAKKLLEGRTGIGQG